ncbi:MAG: glycoside hydrolase family 97 N-terminal domain-containing protein [Chitinophagaceae bacterium]
MKGGYIFFFFLSISIIYAQKISSPDGHVILQFALQEKGIPTYKIAYKEKTVIKHSKLGIIICTSYPYINFKNWDKYFRVDSV